jgi:hypothetical protein
LLIQTKIAEQEGELADLETNYYNIDNPELKRAQVIKQRELARRSNELALEKANVERVAEISRA